MCYNPYTVWNRKTKKTMWVSCRKCDECYQARANEWALRCSMELKDHEESCFITLTYKNNPIGLFKSDMQKFIKRLRKELSPKKPCLEQ